MKKKDEKAKKALEADLRRAIKEKNHKRASDISLDIAQLHRDNGEREEAIQYLEKVYKLAEAANVRTDRILALRGCAEMHAEEGEDKCNRYLKLYEQMVKDDPTEYQLMTTVAAWCILKMYSIDDRNESLLRQAEEYGVKSLQMLENEEIIETRMLKGDSIQIRRTNCHRYLAEIYGYLNEKEKAEGHSDMAFESAKGNKTSQFEIKRARMDFPWRDKVKAAESLCEFAKTMSQDKRYEASLFLAIAYFEAQEIKKGFDIVLEVEATKGSSSMSDEDRERHTNLMVFAYRVDVRSRQLKSTSENDQEGRYRLHDKLGDLYDKAGWKAAAFEHYDAALRSANALQDDKRIIGALTSCAETAADWKKYDKAAFYFDRLAKMEQGLDRDPSESIASRFEMLLLAGTLGSDADVKLAIHKLETDCNKCLHSIYAAAAKYFANKGHGEEAERYKLLELDCPKFTPEAECVDDADDENDSLDAMDDTRIRNIMQEKAAQRAKIRDLSKASRKENSYGESKLIERAREGTLAEVKILVEQGSDVNKADPAGWTPLSEAVGANDFEMVKYLLSKKADPNPQSRDGWVDLPFQGKITPLMEACTNGFYEIANWLLLHEKAKEMVCTTNLDGWSPADFLTDYLKRTSRGEESEADFQHKLGACRKTLERIKQLQRIQGFPVRTGDPPAVQRGTDDTPRYAAEKEATRRAARRERRKGAAENYQEAISSIGSRSKQTEKESKRRSTEMDTEDLFTLSDDEPLIASPPSSAKKKKGILSSDEEEVEKEKEVPRKRKSLDFLDDPNYGLDDDTLPSPLQSMNRSGSQPKRLSGVQRMLQRQKGAKRSAERGDENGISIVADDVEMEERAEKTKRRRNGSESSQSEAGTPARQQTAERRDSWGSTRGGGGWEQMGAVQGPFCNTSLAQPPPLSLSSASALATTAVKVVIIKEGGAPETLPLTKASSNKPIVDLPRQMESLRRAIDGGACAWTFNGDPLDAAVMTLGDLADLYDVKIVELECRVRRTLKGEFEKKCDLSDLSSVSAISDALVKLDAIRPPKLELRNEPNCTEKTRLALWSTIAEYTREKMAEDGKWRADDVIVEQFRDVPSHALRAFIRMRPREGLSLRFCGLDDAKLEEMTEELESAGDARLSTLDLSFNHSILSCETLAKTVTKFRGINTLILQGLSGIEEGRHLMRAMGGMWLNTLVLDENPWLDDSCVEELMRGEAVGKLSVLKIGKVSVRTMTWMKEAEGKLKLLKSLTLAENNGISATGWERVAAFIRSSSIKSIDLKGTAIRPSFLEALAARSSDAPALTVTATRCAHITPTEILRSFSLLLDGRTANLRLHIEKDKFDEVAASSPQLASRFLKAVVSLLIQ